VSKRLTTITIVAADYVADPATTITATTIAEKVKFALEEAIKAQRGSTGIALLFL
jgi:hypothetical protein